MLNYGEMYRSKILSYLPYILFGIPFLEGSWYQLSLGLFRLLIRQGLIHLGLLHYFVEHLVVRDLKNPTNLHKSATVLTVLCWRAVMKLRSCPSKRLSVGFYQGLYFCWDWISGDPLWGCACSSQPHYCTQYKVTQEGGIQDFPWTSVNFSSRFQMLDMIHLGNLL